MPAHLDPRCTTRREREGTGGDKIPPTIISKPADALCTQTRTLAGETLAQAVDQRG